jgi:DnaJ-class molecular chaperone
VRCPDCEGLGRLQEEYETGGYSPDRWMEIRVRMVECERCDGRGEIEADPWGDE